MNYVEKLAGMLGIEVGVPFNVNENDIKYRFDEDGAFSWETGDGYWSRDLVLTGHFLQGMLTAKWKPGESEKYYTVDPAFASGVYPLIWSETLEAAKILYDAGLVFRTEEEAAAKAKEYGWIK